MHIYVTRASLVNQGNIKQKNKLIVLLCSITVECGFYVRLNQLTKHNLMLSHAILTLF